jgi:hypothetical protein
MALIPSWDESPPSSPTRDTRLVVDAKTDHRHV